MENNRTYLLYPMNTFRFHEIDIIFFSAERISNLMRNAVQRKEKFIKHASSGRDGQHNDREFFIVLRIISKYFAFLLLCSMGFHFLFLAHFEMIEVMLTYFLLPHPIFN